MVESTVRNPLVDALVARQEREALNDTDFALKLGVSLSHWWRTKYEGRRVGLSLLRAIVRTYPELQPHVSLFLANGSTVSNVHRANS